jgi:hypothetical protein
MASLVLGSALKLLKNLTFVHIDLTQPTLQDAQRIICYHTVHGTKEVLQFLSEIGSDITIV